MDYGLLTYNFKDHFNLGDYIQSLAARQFLPRVDRFIDREKLRQYSGPRTKMIMNGWYMRNGQQWPPSGDIAPLLTSFHLNPRCRDEMLSGKGLEYFRSHQPVGCRDKETFEILRKNGIEAYLSNCLTLTLGNSYRHDPAGTDVYLVDILFRYPVVKDVFKSFNSFWKSMTEGKIFLLGKQPRLMRSIFGSLVDNAKAWTHHYASGRFPTEESRFELAEETLRRYSRARLVITSRIHCALPCLAMGTPVIFVEGGFENPTEQCRLNGIAELFNFVKISRKGEFESNFDLNAFLAGGMLPERKEHLKYLEKLNQTCKAFIKPEP